MDYVELGKRVRMMRCYRDITQQQLAEKVGISTSFVGHVERGSRKASVETIIGIARVLHVDLNYLFAAELPDGKGDQPQEVTQLFDNPHDQLVDLLQQALGLLQQDTE